MMCRHCGAKRGHTPRCGRGAYQSAKKPPCEKLDSLPNGKKITLDIAKEWANLAVLSESGRRIVGWMIREIEAQGATP